jgi:hypothetical protein
MDGNSWVCPESTVECFQRLQDEKLELYRSGDCRMLAVLFDFFPVDCMIARRRINEVSKAVEADFTFCTRLALEVMEKSMLFLICNLSAKYREATSAKKNCHFLTFGRLDYLVSTQGASCC